MKRFASAETAVKLAPDLAEAHRILAVGLHISLRLDEAAAEYKRTLELDPDVEGLARQSRRSLSCLGQSRRSTCALQRTTRSRSERRAARAGKVISLLELSRTEEANSALDAALTADPRNLPLLAGTAYWFAAHDNNEKAFDLARRAIAIEPRYTWAQVALSRAYLGLKRPLNAERAMRYARQYGKFPTLDVRARERARVDGTLRGSSRSVA